MSDRRRVPVRPARGFSGRIPPFPPAFPSVRAIENSPIASNNIFLLSFQFLFVIIEKNSRVKRQYGHIRKNDVFVSDDPEESAGVCVEATRQEGRIGAGLQIFRSLTKKRRTAKGVE
ncbi:hypothetical protein [Burkholderia seminalis]|uniref:hypothetical protein n=1 Tax=Burkholderia seminalis TaxID=488731 RepID=UPI0019085D8C|nr:hypothetical protein [Burkholderia seminalis]MBJ9968717.1 hypothetical protein [Burkholderia seminalis]MDN7591227.1 hypothetical protein [Burkholderia seminalis]